MPAPHPGPAMSALLPDDDPDEAAAAVAVMSKIEEGVLDGIALQLAGPEPVSEPEEIAEDAVS